ncbi:MAG: LacI family DNA-binding transcriptional regulator [Verrucomicrobia bacterium]|jgi:DNA-binding LacI/PurR family transcriptional regulator|nr:LacI family DNA-binding transcriptional regulator [Verrucomicrobiota bacterium]
MMSLNITLADVAREAGVSYGTASQAMRGVGEVAEKTAERVRAVAARLGYRPNAAGALLAAGRHGRPGRKKPLLVEVLAHPWPSVFEEACAALGYDGKSLVMPEDVDPAGWFRQLWGRGAEGLLISHALDQRGVDWKALDLKRFALVKRGRILPELPVHCVRISSALTVDLSLQSIIERGYRRILACFLNTVSRIDDDVRHGIALNHRERNRGRGVAIRCPRFDFMAWEVESPRFLTKLEKEIERFAPDAILAFPAALFHHLREAGYRIPTDFGFAATALPTSDAEVGLSGCLNQNDEQVRRGTYLLHQTLLGNERGIPRQTNEQNVSPIWSDGVTLPVRVGGRMRPEGAI